MKRTKYTTKKGFKFSERTFLQLTRFFMLFRKNLPTDVQIFISFKKLKSFVQHKK